MIHAKLLTSCVLVWLLVVCCPSVQAEFIVDDFAAPDPSVVRAISLIDPNPSLVETADASVMGGERDVLLTVVGSASPISFIGEIGGGSLQFASSIPGTTAVLQYDGLDADPLGPPASLVNSESVGGLNLGLLGSIIALEFSRIDGGSALATGLEIEVHSTAGSSSLSTLIPDSGVPTVFTVPMTDFSDVSVFADVTSMEVRLNPAGTPDVDFQLDTIKVIGPPVPEPSTALLLATFGLGLGLCLWRRRTS